MLCAEREPSFHSVSALLHCEERFLRETKRLLARRFLAHVVQSDDILQGVYLRVLRSRGLAKFEHREGSENAELGLPFSWKTLLEREICDLSRRSRCKKRSLVFVATPDLTRLRASEIALVAAPSSLERDEISSAVRAALCRLEPRKRALAESALCEGAPLSSVCSSLRISYGTGRRMLEQIKGVLRSLLREFDPREDAQA